jgi:hypothetical protein
MKQLLLMAAVPGSKGQGVSSFCVLGHLPSTLSVVASAELVGRVKPRGEADDFEENDSEMEVDSDPSLDRKALSAFCTLYASYKELFLDEADISLFESYAESLLCVLFLATCKSDYSSLKPIAASSLVEASEVSERAYLAVMKQLLPPLIMSEKDTGGMPKHKTPCHKAAVKIAVDIIGRVPAVSGVSHPDAGEIASAGSGVEEPPLPTRLAAVVGIMQRMLLVCPDKAPARAGLAASIATLVTTIASSAAASDSSEGSSRCRAVNKYMSFVASMTRSQKIARRAFAVEVAAELMRIPLVWTLGRASAAASSRAAGAEAMLAAVVGRCRDIAPTVRSRALLAFSSLIDDLGAVLIDHPLSSVTEPVDSAQFAGCPVELCQSLYRLAIGGGDRRSNNSGSSDSDAERYTAHSDTSVIDTLRGLTSDEKPTSRVKALRAYSAALSIKWPNVASSDGCSGISAETVSMLVTDEDVAIFARACSDPNVSVRKQAIDSMTDLLWSRPVDCSIQEAWVCSVLPLVMDSESTVQQKAALSVLVLVLETCVEWQEAVRGRGGKMMASAALALGWRLSCKLADVGMTKMLNAAVAILIRDGFVNMTSPAHGQVSVKSIVASVETACQFEQRAGGPASLSDGAMFACDAEEVTHGGWVILESLISQTATGLAGADGKQDKAMQTLYRCDFVLSCWEHRCSRGVAMGSHPDDVRILRAIELMASHNAEIAHSSRFSSICDGLYRCVADLNCSSSMTSAAFGVLMAPIKLLSSGEKAHRFAAAVTSSWFDKVLRWCSVLMDSCYAVIHVAVFGTSRLTSGLWDSRPSKLPGSFIALADPAGGSSPSNTATLNCALFVLGEISMLGFANDEDDSFAVADALQRQRPHVAMPKLQNAFKIVFPEALVELIPLLLPERLPCESISGDASAGAVIPESIRAHAFVTMGKLCIRDKPRAAHYINIFLRELQIKDAEGNKGASVRLNALMILGDLCVRFTNLVDRHVGTLASCLQDSDVNVRKHAFVLLVQLLLQDFLRWRGTLLYRFLATVVDPDAEVSSFARMALNKAMNGKYSGIFKQHFVDAVIIFNGCTDHPAFTANDAVDGAESVSDFDDAQLSGSDERSRARRRRIYEFIMEGMTEEEKIQTTAKFVQDILSFSVDNPALLRKNSRPGVPSALEEALIDSFWVLRSPQLKVGGKRTGAGKGMEFAAEDEDGAETQEAEHAEVTMKAAMQNAKIKVLKKLSVQHMIEHILPAVASLKHVLERHRSLVQRVLMEYLVELVKAHKAEVDQTLSTDPVLKSEIEYDIKLFDREKEAALQQSKLAAASAAADQALAITNNTSASKQSTGRRSLGSGDLMASPSGDAMSVAASTRRKSFGGFIRSPAVRRGSFGAASVRRDENGKPLYCRF